MPWENQAENKKQHTSNNLRLAFVFHVHCPDEQRLATLLYCAKYRNLWYEHWGGVAFTVEQPDFTTPAGVKDRYIEMVQSHGAIQLSMGRQQFQVLQWQEGNSCFVLPQTRMASHASQLRSP
jgi:hypothetical protein